MAVEAVEAVHTRGGHQRRDSWASEGTAGELLTGYSLSNPAITARPYPVTFKCKRTEHGPPLPPTNSPAPTGD